MRRWLRSAADAAGVVALALAGLVPAGPAGASPARPGVAPCHPLGVVRTPSPGSYDDLLAVSALSNSDVWAVGRYITPGSKNQTLAEHWDGTSFRQVPSPDPAANDLLYGVDAVSPADVWTVGATFPATREVDATLIEHWDGSAWRVVPSPPLSSGSGLLRTVTGDSPGDLWAVGTALSGVTDTQAAPLAERWDGRAWQVLPAPDPSRFGSYLSSASVVSPGDVWAVGTSYVDSHGGTQTLIEHWNGARWSVVPSPSPGIDGALTSVSAVSGRDIWAVGRYFSNTGGGSLVVTLAEHFDGSRWTVVPTPSPDVHDSLAAVQAAGHADVWAVGGSSTPTAELVEHWDGTRWRVAAEPYRAGNANYLYALAGSRSPGVWVAGSFAGRNGETLAEHFCRA